MYLDYAEEQAERRTPLYMRDWREKLDGFLQFRPSRDLEERAARSRPTSRSSSPWASTRRSTTSDLPKRPWLPTVRPDREAAWADARPREGRPADERSRLRYARTGDPASFAGRASSCGSTRTTRTRSFVDDSAPRQKPRGEFPFPVVGFRGSFLDLLFRLEPYGSGLDQQPLLIHMPGFNEESIRKTPVLELYEPGVRYRKGLDTLIREAATSRVAPAEVETFVAKQPTLEEADAWLSSRRDRRARSASRPCSTSSARRCWPSSRSNPALSRPA